MRQVALPSYMETYDLIYSSCPDKILTGGLYVYKNGPHIQLHSGKMTTLDESFRSIRAQL